MDIRHDRRLPVPPAKPRPRLRTAVPFTLALASLLLTGRAAIPAESESEPTGALRVPPPSATLAAPAASGIPGASTDRADRDPQREAALLKQEAVQAASAVTEAYPNDPLSYALLGSAFYNTGQSAEATRQLRRCLELNPAQVDAYDLLARMAYERGDPAESARLSREAAKHAPDHAEVLNRLGRSLLDLGETAEAINMLERAARLPGATGETHYLLGQARMQSGDFAGARDSFRRTVELVPDHTQAYFGLYTACLRQGQIEEAGRYREQFQALEAIDRQALTDRNAREDTLTGLPLVRQTSARTLFGAAQVHRVHGKPDLAAELLYRAAALDEGQATYRVALEAHYVQRKALGDGVKAFERLAAAQPGNSLNQLYLGRLHARLQHFDEAARAYRRAVELAPDRPEGYRALTELYLRADREPVETLGLARKLVELQPIAPHYQMLAAACLKNQDHAGAVAAMERAVALSPDNENYRQILRQLQSQSTPPTPGRQTAP